MPNGTVKILANLFTQHIDPVLRLLLHHVLRQRPEPPEEREHLPARQDLDDGVELRAVTDATEEVRPVLGEVEPHQVGAAGAAGLVAGQHSTGKQFFFSFQKPMEKANVRT